MENEKPIEIRMYGSVYKTVYRYEFLLPVIATSGVGFISFGPIGLTAGALGMTDVMLQHYNVCNKSYLTASFLGWGMLSSFKMPYYIAEIAGVSVGGLSQNNLIYPHVDKIIAPINGAIHGYSYLGTSGAAMGFAAGMVDEGLSQFNISHSYPFSSTLKNIAVANLFIPQSLRALNHFLPDVAIKPSIIEFAKYIATTPSIKNDIATVSLAAYFGTETQKLKSSILELGEDLYNAYSKIIPSQQLDKLIEHQAIALFAGQIILAKLELIAIANQQNIVEAFNSLIDTDASWRQFIQPLSHSTSFFLPYILNTIIIQRINQYFSTKLYFAASDPLHDELLTGEISIHLKQPRVINAVNSDNELIESIVLVDNMSADIAAMSYNTLLPDALSSVVKGVYAIGYLSSVNAIDTILYFSVYNELSNDLTKSLSNKIHSYSNTLKNLYSEIVDKFNHPKNNADLMIIYDANAYNKAGQRAVIDEIREVEAEQHLWLALNDLWLKAHSNLGVIFNLFVVADHIYHGVIDRSKKAEIISMAASFSSMAGWEAHNSGGVSALSQSISRITEIKTRMSEVHNPVEHQPLYYYEKSDKTGICLHNFKVGKGDESRLYINDLCIRDKVVAITSASGAGKSTFLKAIKQIKHGGVWSEGEITYFTKNGTIPSIVMTGQETYIVPGNTLLEHITFKKGLAAEPFRERVVELLKALKTDAVTTEQTDLISNLDLKNNWPEHVSPGQKQKINAVRLMLPEDKPDIVILDEIFAGQDHTLISTLQALLNKEFPYSQIYVVDHEAKSHNSNGFYHNELHLSEETAQLIGPPTFD